MVPGKTKADAGNGYQDECSEAVHWRCLAAKNTEAYL